uniref:Aminotransferase class I/classII large domain-containing protein n=1 Tax=Prasinoderma singulare TaxID=676789 RepID=A0A7S3BC52_9VIRI|mmetsp:Transcript_14515/g.45389  ORF Transcript_14515/g.45389 Transcript_14515/m.45389 type:complete len:439 (+) Transcript_14515:28-1344(+)
MALRCAAPSRAVSLRGARAARVQPRAMATGVQRNANIGKLQAGYLFPEIARRRNEHMEANPDAEVISLGIGDTTEPIDTAISGAMADAANGLSTREGYSGYGAEQGRGDLREQLADVWYKGIVDASEVFVSDGSKCDISRLQMMFGPEQTVAVQDPSYPAYVDTSVMMGMTETYDDATSQFKGIEYMPCLPETGFFPDLASMKKTDVIFFCSPNNPTGAAATKEQLTELVNFARKNGSIIVYDAAYALYIKDENCPKSIFEIEGARECALETNSFSKAAGFTGVRLGWTVVPKELKFADGTPVINDFNRVMCTCFNGASNVVQAGGMAALSPEGFKAMEEAVAFYSENATILKNCFKDLGFEVHGGADAPYVWVRFPGQTSWDSFAQILKECNIVTTPGSGFGPSGEGFVRASAFGSRDNVHEAVKRFQAAFKGKVPA